MEGGGPGRGRGKRSDEAVRRGAALPSACPSLPCAWRCPRKRLWGPHECTQVAYRRDQYKRCANLLEAVGQLMEHFAEYSHVPKIQVCTCPPSRFSTLGPAHARLSN